jgi:hypothetical protein
MFKWNGTNQKRPEVMTFDIEHYSDGLRSKYGNEYGLNLEEAVEHLIYFDYFSQKYSEEELTELLTNMKADYRMMGTRWFEFKVTKK